MWSQLSQEAGCLLAKLLSQEASVQRSYFHVTLVKIDPKKGREVDVALICAALFVICGWIPFSFWGHPIMTSQGGGHPNLNKEICEARVTQQVGYSHLPNSRHTPNKGLGGPIAKKQ